MTTDAPAAESLSRPSSEPGSGVTPESEPWDLVVIGGGTAGLVASQTAAGFGARVLLIESDRPGGDCLWTGCVPSKALVASANAAHAARGSARLGVTGGPVSVDFARVMQHIHEAIATIEPVDSAETLERSGVTVRIGRARFTGAHTIEISDGTSTDGTSTDGTSTAADGEAGGADPGVITFRQAIVATGSSPSMPAVEGIGEIDALTNESFWDLRELPARLLVLGAGSIGCEIGQAMARLGSEVTIVERERRVLPGEDVAASDVIASALAEDGVTVRAGAELRGIRSKDRSSGIATLDDGSEVRFDRLLVAIGRVPSTASLGLDSARVNVDEAGFIVVDEQLRTSNRRIRAAGDVTGPPLYTHTAGVNASVAAMNVILGLSRKVESRVVPRVTFTSPEVAAIGIGAADAAARARRIVTFPHAELDRAIAEGNTSGYTRLIVDGRGRILGASVVGPRAGETLGELTLAMRHRLTTTDIAATTHAYPTWNDAVWNPSVSVLRGRLGRGILGVAVRALKARQTRKLR